jgi:hypothetical protein
MGRLNRRCRFMAETLADFWRDYMRVAQVHFD